MEKNATLANAAMIFMGTIVLLFILQAFQTVIRPLVIALMLAVLFSPIAHKKKKRSYRLVAIALILVSLFATVALIGSLVFGESEQVKDLGDITRSRSFTDRVQEISTLSIGQYTVDLTLFYEAQDVASLARKGLMGIMNGVGTFLQELFMVGIYLIFLLPYYQNFFTKLQDIASKKKKQQFVHVITKIQESIRDYLGMKTIISIGTALCSLIFLLLFNAPFPIIIAFMIFILNYIPNFGSIIAVGLALGPYFFFSGPTWSFFVLAMLLTTVQMFFGNYLEPKVTGKKLSLAPIVVVVSLFFWGALWGVIGMFIAVPLTAIIKITLEQIEETKHIAEFFT